MKSSCVIIVLSGGDFQPSLRAGYDDESVVIINEGEFEVHFMQWTYAQENKYSNGLLLAQLVAAATLHLKCDRIKKR
jgi:hypothetical protein